MNNLQAATRSNMNQYPKVSCLCVSRGGEHLLKAIECFKNQTYENKELIIVAHRMDPLVLGIVRAQGPEIRLFHAFGPIATKEAPTLGQQRNWSVKHATGYWVCIWDDDDLHHPGRIEQQLRYVYGHQHASGRDYPALDGCTLNRVYMTDKIGAVYISENKQTGWEGTLLCKRELLTKNPYPAVQRQEDSALVTKLFRTYDMDVLIRPELYVYRQHDNNVSGEKHWEYLLRHAKLIEQSNKWW